MVVYPVFLVSDCGGHHHIFNFPTQQQQKIMEYQDLKGKKAVVTGAGAGNNNFEIDYPISYYFF